MNSDKNVVVGYLITPEEWRDVMYSVIGISPFQSQDPDDMKDYPIPDGVEILKNVRHRGFVCNPIQSEQESVLDELEETIDNWWRTYNDLDYDTYRRIPDKGGKNRFKHHHNMRTVIYKKYKMFFDCCKSPEGLQRMREFNTKVKEHLGRRNQRNPVEPMETLI